MISACTEDDPDPVVRPSSSITLISPSTIPASGIFIIDLTALSGDSPLNSLTILKDGFGSLDAADITINSSVAASNPILLFEPDRTSFSYTISIQTDLGSGESATYSFIVETDNSELTTESVTISVDEVPPHLSISGGNPDITCPASSLKSLEFAGVKVGGSLSSFAVYEDGVLIDTARLLEFGGEDFTSNPFTLTGGDQDGFTKDVIFRLHNTNESKRYLFELVDENGLFDTLSFNVTAETGTAVTTITSDTLWNFAGPNAGSLQVPMFNAVFSSETNWDIRDNGNDLNGKWLKTFRINPDIANLELRIAATSDWISLESYEDMEAAWTSATVTGGTSNEFNTTDIYLLSKDSELYAINATEVLNTMSDNEDYYIFQVKKK
jgi:hypothetical protein